MMNELFLLRHCKSDWGAGLSSDSERPLSARGIDNASRLGNWMKQNGYIPAQILCSTAVRAEQTIQLVCKESGIDDQIIKFLPELYLASRASLISIINTHREGASPVMIVGHNPGLDELVKYLAKQQVPYTDEGKLMTTGCLARFSLPEAEQDLENKCELLSITRPSEI
jgi:phosphohistidine phosphatase